MAACLKGGDPMMTALTLFISTMLLAPADQPAVPAQAGKAVGPLFATADKCMACHNGLTSPSGEDVSIGNSWRSSMMANAARDPYWQAAVRREVMDHPKAQAVIENECSACHMPMTRFEAKASGRLGEIFAHLPIMRAGEGASVLAADGVSCTACHQIQEKNFGRKESFTGGFSVDTEVPPGRRPVFGRFKVASGLQALMQSASDFRPEEARHIGSAEHCATCHTLYTHALGPDGDVVGELPEQVPYLEWRHSSYRETKTCQACHMPRVEAPMRVSSVLGEMHDGLSRHMFNGGNFFIPRMLNRFRDELGVTALPSELDAMALGTIHHLQSESARLAVREMTISEGRLEAVVSVENLAGHKLPSAYPSRRAWIRFLVHDSTGRTIFESGGFQPDGSISGNANDSDSRLFEPHYDLIDRPDQVQIYEAIMVDPKGAVTTGLLKATRYVKDNRLLPDGFDKTTAMGDIAVRGEALQDDDFLAGRDQVRYSVPLGSEAGPLVVLAELWYQPIGFRWARNLGDVDAFETRRFFSYYSAMAETSAIVLTRDSVHLNR
jgi:hypothetical protein